MPRIERQMIITNKKGLHARPAALFVQIANKYQASVMVANGAEKVNGRSIMGLLTLGAQYQTPLTLTVEGDDAQVAIEEFEAFFSKQDEELLP